VKQHNATASEIRKRLSSAFRELRRSGYFARSNFWCCQSCAWSAVPEEKAKTAVFYHQQDADGLSRTGELYLAWSGNAELILATLSRNGLSHVWDGSPDTRIQVTGLSGVSCA